MHDDLLQSTPGDLYAEALMTFAELLDEARVVGEPEPTAMTLASADPDARVSVRTMLLKGYDERGFVFYTNLESHKGQQMAANPQVALLFLWKALRQQVQVKIEGQVEPVSEAEADAYFASRPRASQLGAWASLQSQTLESRETFEHRLDAFEAKFRDAPVPRPPHWSGRRVLPNMIEFWYGAQYRLHERQRYERGADGVWARRMLYP